MTASHIQIRPRCGDEGLAGRDLQDRVLVSVRSPECLADETPQDNVSVEHVPRMPFGDSWAAAADGAKQVAHGGERVDHEADVGSAVVGDGEPLLLGVPEVAAGVVAVSGNAAWMSGVTLTSSGVFAGSLGSRAMKLVVNSSVRRATTAATASRSFKRSNPSSALRSSRQLG
jgi:hypothetical protein